MNYLTFAANQVPGAFRRCLFETAQHVMTECLDSEAMGRMCAGVTLYSRANINVHQNNASIRAPINIGQLDGAYPNNIDVATRILVPFETRQEVVQQVLPYMDLRMFEIVEGQDVIQRALPLMTSEMNIFQRIQIFNGIVAIPIAERQAVIQQVCLFTTPEMDEDDKVRILRAIAAIPVAARQDVVQQALLLMTSRMCERVRARILNAVAEIPNDERQAVIQQTLSLMTPEMSESDREGILRAVVAIPIDERDHVVKEARFLMTPLMSQYERVEILRAIAEIPAATRGIIGQETAYLITPEMEFPMIKRILHAVVAIPIYERQELIQQACSLMTPRMSEYDREEIFAVVSAIPVAERVMRAIVVQRAAFLITPEMECEDVKRIIAAEIAHLAAEIAHVNPFAHVAAERANVRQAAMQMNVHDNDRDECTRRAVELLYRQQGPIKSTLIDQANREFIAYLNASSRSLKQKQLAQLALEGTPAREEFGETFGPLIDEAGFSLNGFLVSGKELFGRLWIFASQLPENDQMNAKESMITELVNSYNDGTRICNQGKTQRLAIAVLQGNLPGAVIEEVRAEGVPPPVTDIVREFFTKEAHTKIETLPALIEAAHQFCKQRPLITSVIREAFIQELRIYAEIQGIQ